MRIEKKHIKWIVATLFFLLILLMLLLMSSEQNPTKEEAIRFNNTIVKDYREIIAVDDSCIEMMRYDVFNMDSSVFRLQTVVEEKMIKYASMSAFDKEDILRKAFKQFLKTYYKLAFVDYPKIAKHFQQIKNKEIEDKDIYIIFIKEIDKKVSEAKKKFFVKQKEFKAQYYIQ